MTKRRGVLNVALIVLFGWRGPALAQGTQTGSISGTVAFADDGKPLPGVTVAITAASLQGTRSTLTDPNGGYIFKGLPAGSYTVSFELSGMAGLKKEAVLALGESRALDARLALQGVQESMEVVAEAPAVASIETGASYTDPEIDSLATARSVVGIAELAPGLSDNAPRDGQLTISGAFAYETLFLIDGVDAADNVFSSVGGPNTPFIEEAIEETRVLTSGISAEYGRFSGGVVNVVTKRGGNAFSGSFRADLSNPSWRSETPLEKDEGIQRESDLSEFYEATLGGPILKDRLWFFAAAHTESTSSQGTFPFSNIAFRRKSDNRRLEGKLTGTIASRHTLQASYTYNKTENEGPSFDFSIAPTTIDKTERPNRLFVASYNGVLGSSAFAELQYSQKKFGIRDANGADTSLNTGSPFFTFGESVEEGLHYNGPYFDFATDPEDRDNRQLTGSLSYFLSGKSAGRHDIKGGFEYFEATLRGGNSQSPTGFIYDFDYKIDESGDPVLDGNGNPIPVFEPFGGFLENWIATRGARLDFKTLSFYLNDRWQLGAHLSFNLGGRYERVTSDSSQSGVPSLDAWTIVPRLGASVDLLGDGRFKLDGSYARYAGKYNPALFGSNQAAGFPDRVFAFYVGPPGEGLDFAPGFDPENYFFFDGRFPKSNVSFDGSLKSPVTHEYSLGAGARLGDRGDARVVFTSRKVTGFAEDFITFDLGQVEVTSSAPCLECQGPFLLDRVEYRNTDAPQRKYQALQLQLAYRPTEHWSFRGHWTVQLKNEGDFEGETRNTPALGSGFGDYPEILVPGRNFPRGRLDDFQRHKVRAWTSYEQSLGRLGGLTLGVLWRHASALTYSLVAENQDPSEIQLSRDPGYATTPLVDVFFGARGAGSFKGAHLFDVALTYAVPVYKSLRPYVKLDVRNVLDDATLGAGPAGFNTAIAPDYDGPLDADGIPTSYLSHPNFGEATSNDSYPVPREFRIALGFRF